jgi:hypothetical protein
MILTRTTCASGDPARHDALGRRGREPDADQLDQQIDREAVREQERLGAAIRTCGEQLQRLTTAWLGAAS